MSLSIFIHPILFLPAHTFSASGSPIENSKRSFPRQSLRYCLTGKLGDQDALNYITILIRVLQGQNLCDKQKILLGLIIGFGGKGFDPYNYIGQVFVFRQRADIERDRDRKSLLKAEALAILKEAYETTFRSPFLRAKSSS